MPTGVRISEFDTFREGYAGASVRIFVANTTSLAPVFLDPQLSMAASNPQTLITYSDDNGNKYGKWSAPIYVNGPYELSINDNSTGIENVPLISLAGEVVSASIAQATRGTYSRTIADWLDRDVWAPGYGSLNENDGSAVCTATLLAAIGAAAAQNGGFVDLPAGNIPFTTVELPQGVVLRGKGVGVTTLRSLNAQACVVLGGDGAGLTGLTLDGINVISGSIGVYGVDTSSPVFEDVLVKRFETGIRFKGTSTALWRNLSVLNCTTGAHLRGDTDSGASNAGTAIENIRWEGGRVSLNTLNGLYLEFFDQAVRNVTLASIGFVGNTTNALNLNGARNVEVEDCYWANNINDIIIQDGTNLALVDLNTVENVTMLRGRMVGGTLVFGGSCSNVTIREMKFEGVSFDLVIPDHTIFLIDCIEDAAVTSTGDTTKLLRASTQDRGIVAGITGDATPITAWSQLLAPGAVALIVVKAVARQRNGQNFGVWHIQSGVSRPGATMNVSLVTTAFTVGAILHGQTSGASARIIGAATPSPGTASLGLRDIAGVFQPGELVVDSSNGSGRMNGQLTYADAALDSGGVTELRAAVVTGGSGYVTAIDTSGGQVRVRVTGAAGHIVEWTAEVAVTEP